MRSTIILAFIFTLSIHPCMALAGILKDGMRMQWLKKPTGEYRVGFEDFHWINPAICPDPMSGGKNRYDFSRSNRKFCHEMMVRIYYPTRMEFSRGSPYYPPFVHQIKNELEKVQGTRSNETRQLEKIKSFSVQNAPVVKGEKFPVLLFSPGFGVQAEVYENTINDLVSHGYIVVGINTLFINGAIRLPDGHTVKAGNPQNRKDAASRFLPIQIQDLSYVFKKLHEMHQLPLFSSMDLSQIGVFGHSIGARTVAVTVQAHPDWFKAAATLDVAFYEKSPLKVFSIPAMHIISAYWKHYFAWPIIFNPRKNSWLVVVSPSSKNLNYSYHMNFSDYSTLQYSPVFIVLAADMKGKASDFNLMAASGRPKKAMCRNFLKATYVLFKNENLWHMYFCDDRKNLQSLDIDDVVGLKDVVMRFLKKAPKDLSAGDLDSVKAALKNYRSGLGGFLGAGNGWEITDAVNQYLTGFFDHFIKKKHGDFLKKCSRLTSNTYIEC